jgi:outer membrane protein assembly factor BamB
MKLFYVLVILIIFQSCSFDNKTGIWKNENSISNKDNDLFNEFKKISISEDNFNKVITLKKNFKFQKSNPVDNFQWNDIFYSKNNNLKNFKYNYLNRIIFKSKKITRHKVNNYLLFEENNLIVSDQKGNIIIFSINKNKMISKFNFYKKQFKKIKKNLNYIVENNIIYVSDNIGYVYAFDYKNNKILWAKNYKIPFRSNLKILDNKIMVSNQNNNLYFLNKKNGNILKLIPTEETIVKNQFINSLSINKNDTLLFLNSYGSLYSINVKTMRINWFINLNQTLDLNPSNLFFGTQIVNNENKVIISSLNKTYIIDSSNGFIEYKYNFSSLIKPLIHKNIVFFVTKNDLLISLNLNNGKIVYSYDINKQIAEFFNVNKKNASFKNIMLLNNDIIIFLQNSYTLNFNINGKLKDVSKLPSKINTYPIIIDGSILYLDKKNKISIIN